MNKLCNYNLGLFFTQGVGLEIWDKIGMIEREIEPYNILAAYFNKIFFFTYGNKKELQYKKLLKSNIEIIINDKEIDAGLYAFRMPFIHKKVIKSCDFFKTNQMKGAQAALIAKKLINRKAKLIVRTGYTWSLFARNEKQFTPLIEFLERNVYKNCDEVIVSSEGDKQFLLEKYKFVNGKTHLIPNFVNVDKFKPVEKRKNSSSIIYVGRLHEQKNLLNLIKALSGTNISLFIIGSGPLENKLKKCANELDVKINFIGNVLNSRLPFFLNEHQIFVLPSLYEGMPKSLMEAMSCGLACVATDVNGSRELIKDLKTGLLSQTDFGSLRANILKLNKNNILREKLGKNARKFIIDNYSLEDLIKKEIKIYENLA